MSSDSMLTTDCRTTVRAMLAAAGLAPSQAEFEQLVEQYPMLRLAFDMMWMVPTSVMRPPGWYSGRNPARSRIRLPGHRRRAWRLR
jgi:hypothetical protein